MTATGLERRPIAFCPSSFPAASQRSLLLNNPILQHPGAPCHALLTQLASLSAPAPHAPAHSASAIPTSGGLTEGNGGFRGPTQASYGAHRRNDGHYGMSPQLPSRSMPPPPPHLPRSMPPPMPRPPSHPGPGASSSAAGVSARDAWLRAVAPRRFLRSCRSALLQLFLLRWTRRREHQQRRRRRSPVAGMHRSERRGVGRG